MEVVKVEGLSKAYQLGQFSTGTLSNDLKRWWALSTGKEDPFLAVGKINDRTQKADSNMVWSLKDINFSINEGDTVGIIGRNGAGKSTLLKILSQITAPTMGSVKLRGRIASLLEVGTGFHPELTGRENIYLNGSILGMRRAEITSKFEEIVEFSGVARYIDTPVKRYSSGMYVRLAFAVAAHLESEILIVDEVLAVGDSEFQKKCLGKMSDISTKKGRTVLFVSHNLQAVRQLCKKGVLLKNGQLTFMGDSQTAISDYLKDDLKLDGYHRIFEPNQFSNSNYSFNSIRILNNQHEIAESLFLAQDYFLELNYQVKISSPRIKISLIIASIDGTTLFGSLNNLEDSFSSSMHAGTYVSKIKLPAHTLNNGTFTVTLSTFNEYGENIFAENVMIFEMFEDGILKGNYTGGYGGYFRPKLEWETKKVL